MQNLIDKVKGRIARICETMVCMPFYLQLFMKLTNISKSGHCSGYMGQDEG